MLTLLQLIPIILTLLVFSRLIGDNALFRIVQYLFVGVSLGLAFVVVYHQVLKPNAFQIAATLNNPAATALRITPFVLGLLLVPRVVGRQTWSWLANIPLGLLFGVGAALALGGALTGTLLPQILDTVRPTGADPVQLGGMILLALGVVATLSYFYFTAPRDTPLGRVVSGSAWIGRWLLMIAFGFFFAGSLLTYITALNQRAEFIISWFQRLL